MSNKKPKIEKIFYSISEVAKMMGVNTSQIRYWENNFDELNPQKNKKGNRLFTPKDIEDVKLIHYLVKQRGLTIKGAQLKLKENRDETMENFEVVNRLKEIRHQLIEIRDAMESRSPNPKNEQS
ncbi:MAG TPA: MerR family transcriptional regulator [Prolixibacteraceae bacterium]|nr:MerR family transcriptional regulator [Prolixibacteraceae bacterium]